MGLCGEGVGGVGLGEGKFMVNQDKNKNEAIYISQMVPLPHAMRTVLLGEGNFNAPK